MASEARADPALFRRRVFEEEWLRPLQLAVAEGDMLEHILAVEAESWARIGVAVGYFAGALGELQPGVKTVSSVDAHIPQCIRAIEPWPELDVASFAHALGAAREDLTPDRRLLLRLVLLASEDDWDVAIRRLSAFRISLQRREPASLETLEALSWALEGTLGPGTTPLDELQSRLPACWRCGSMTVLRDCSPAVAQRLDAVLAERDAIVEALKRTFEADSIDIETLVACRDAAVRQDWALFDDIFRGRLMRGYREYLCETLGAWEETLGLAQLAEDPSFPAELTPQPGYYSITVARCLKHLGRSAESRAKYIESLRKVAQLRDPDTALYVNNFLTLLIWRGELSAADQLTELNVRALSWIQDPWRHRWQVEHGFSSIAYLRLLQGEFDAASVLFDHAARAWDGYAGERPWIYDYYPYYRSELVLLTDPGAHDEALVGIESLLAVAAARSWPESICRGHIQAAIVHTDRSSRLGDPEALRLARRRLEEASEFTAGISLPDVAIAYYLAWLKVELTHREVDPLASSDTAEVERVIDRVEALVETSGLALATPELVAARGVQAYLEGSIDQAQSSYRRATARCESQGHALAASSPRSLVNWLGRRVGLPPLSAGRQSTTNLVDLVGAELSHEWMIARLDSLVASD